MVDTWMERHVQLVLVGAVSKGTIFRLEHLRGEAIVDIFQRLLTFTQGPKGRVLPVPFEPQPGEKAPVSLQWSTTIGSLAWPREQHTFTQGFLCLLQGRV